MERLPGVKRSRETVVEVHEDGVRQAHHSGETENLERNREVIMEARERGEASSPLRRE